MQIADFVLIYSDYDTIGPDQLDTGVHYCKDAFAQLKGTFRKTFIKSMVGIHHLIMEYELTVPIKHTSSTWAKNVLSMIAQLLKMQMESTGVPSARTELVRTEDGWMFDISVIAVSEKDLN